MKINTLTLGKGDIVELSGKRWYQELYGNTYHSVSIKINGKEVAYIPCQYGYGDYYIETAKKFLNSNGYIKTIRYNNGTTEQLWATAQRTGFTLKCNCCNVGRKKDL